MAIVEAAAHAAPDGSLFNAALSPTTRESRTWGPYSYAALWIGMAHCVTTYLLASALIKLGMSWSQALLTIALGNVVVLAPILLTSHAGTRYGIPFPVLARAPFGVTGANLPALARAVVACGWFGIDAWIGGEATYRLIGIVVGTSWTNAAMLSGHPWSLWLAFFLFLSVNITLVISGLERVRRFEFWAAPIVLVGALALLVWTVTKAHGLGAIVGQHSRLGWGGHFFAVFGPALTGMIAFWAPMALNMPDFTRFARDQRAQRLGQAIGLPATMTIFPLIAIIITSGTTVIYGAPIWDPVTLATRLGTAGAIVGLLIIVIATLSVNIAANLVSPAFDFSNVSPRLIGFRAGVCITAAVAVIAQPWRLLADPHTYIFVWLDFAGGSLGAIAGILIADYWLVRRTGLSLVDLYRKDGRYAYCRGWNWRAVASFVVANVLALGGAYSSAGGGPFPSGGLLPPLRPLYDYSWPVGLATAVVLYTILSRLFPTRTPDLEDG